MFETKAKMSKIPGFGYSTINFNSYCINGFSILLLNKKYFV